MDYMPGFGHLASNLQFVPQIKMDIGSLFGAPDRLYAGMEIAYWDNKFGIDSDVADSDQTAVSAILKLHF